MTWGTIQDKSLEEGKYREEVKKKKWATTTLWLLCAPPHLTRINRNINLQTACHLKNMTWRKKEDKLSINYIYFL